jgi:hypothetical protein
MANAPFSVGRVLGRTFEMWAKNIVKDPVVVLWVDLLVTVVLGSILAIANAVGYHDLRVAKEGVGIEELVSVFA